MEDRQVSLKQVLDTLHGYFDGMLETDTWSPCDVYGLIEMLPSAQPEQRWIPVTKDTLPEEGKVVIVKGLKGTWDFGTYRGFGHINGEENIHRWQWKKNTYKSVYWWMYKDGALPEPHKTEGKEI